LAVVEFRVDRKFDRETFPDFTGMDTFISTGTAEEISG
jgi:hypothetical protein